MCILHICLYPLYFFKLEITRNFKSIQMGEFYQIFLWTLSFKLEIERNLTSFSSLMLIFIIFTPFLSPLLWRSFYFIPCLPRRFFFHLLHLFGATSVNIFYWKKSTLIFFSSKKILVLAFCITLFLINDERKNSNHQAQFNFFHL